MNSRLSRLLLLLVVVICGAWLDVPSRAAQAPDAPQSTDDTPRVALLPMVNGAPALPTDVIPATATTLPRNTPRPSQTPIQSPTLAATDAAATLSPSGTASSTATPS